MGIFYANARGGSDSNNGTSWALAKLTLSGVNGVASAGDTIRCHGIFKETIPVSKQLYWEGWGYCEFNGNGAGGVVPVNLTYFTGITFTGFLTSPFYNGYGMRCSSCIFRDMPYGNYCGYSPGITTAFYNCQFYNCSTSGIRLPDALANLYDFSNCVFFGNSADVIDNTVDAGEAIFRLCCFGSPTMINNVNSAIGFAVNSDYNVYDFTNGVCLVNGVTKSTLATWKTAIGSPRDVNSIDRVWKNDVVDYANRILNSPPSGYLLTAGPINNPIIGLTRTAQVISNNTNSSMWTGGVFSNCSVNGSGYVVLDPGQTVGTVATDVLDMTTSKTIRKIHPFGTGEVPSTNTYFDTDTGDSPNYLNYEFRGSNSAFAKTDGSPTWNTVPRGWDIGLLFANTFRYWQVRVTIRA